jgi:hypothetical protein
MRERGEGGEGEGDGKAEGGERKGEEEKKTVIFVHFFTIGTEDVFGERCRSSLSRPG